MANIDTFTQPAVGDLTASWLPRRLPIVVSPVLGETLESWMDRMSRALMIPVAMLWRCLGGDVLSVNGGDTVFGVTLSDPELLRFAHATGIDSEVLGGLVIDSWHRDQRGPVDLADLRRDPRGVSRLTAVREWATFKTSRFCPSCLGNTGAWQQRWKWGAQGVCVACGSVLVDDCPECATRAQSGAAGRLTFPSPTLVSSPGQCQNLVYVTDDSTYRRRRRCDAGLTTVPAIQLRGDDPAMTAQTSVDAHLDAYLNDEWDMAVPPFVYFDTLRFFEAVGEYGLNADEISSRSPEVKDRLADFTKVRDTQGKPSSVPTWQHGSRDGAVVAAVLPDAVAATDAAIAGDHAQLELLAAACVRRRRTFTGGGTIQRGEGLPDSVNLVWRRAVLAEKGRASLFTLHLDPRSKAADRWDLDVDDIPSGLTGPGLERFKLVVPVVERNVKVFGAMTCLRVLTGVSAPVAAEMLGLPVSATWRSDLTSRKVSAAGNNDAVHDAACQLLTDWAQSRDRGRFGRYRRALAPVTAVPTHVWDDICTDSGVGLYNMEARCRHAAIWVWCDRTGGFAGDAPAMLAAEADGLRRDSLREVQRGFVKWLPDQVADGLRVYADDLIEGDDRG